MHALVKSAVFFGRGSLAMVLVYYVLNKLYVYKSVYEFFLGQPAEQKLERTQEVVFVVCLWTFVHAVLYYGYGTLLNTCYEANYLEQFKCVRARQPKPQKVDMDFSSIAQKESITMVILYALYLLIEKVSVQGIDVQVMPSKDLSFSEVSRLWMYFLGGMLLADLQFYIVHRILHWPFFYKHVHKRHHHYQYATTFDAEIKAVPESLIISVTDLLHFILWGGHMTHLLAWVIVSTMLTLEGHSGYNLFFVPDAFHDDHHVMNSGNFGTGYHLDWLLGTQSPTYLRLLKRESESKRID